ncbi:MAG: SDR family NAD(P)-dependent oxidoreductase [Bacteroidota bacterium]|nr:SDR family NAD(P)-dependent oxidoreductase [Bacteroidota bacterium]
MEKHFKDKVVFITGSSKGIGKATAGLLGSYGAKVCINGRKLESLEETCRELEKNNITCLKLAGDVSDSDQCRGMIDSIIKEYGKLDILINNAGIGSHGKFRELSIDAWDRVVGINLMGPVYMSTFALPHLIKTKGSVVFISTLAGKVGMPGHSTYSVSKMGLSALAEAMQVELEKKGLHTGIIYVGFTENEENKQILYPDGTYKKLPERGQKKARREDVAKEIARLVYKKKKSVTLSTVGKLQGFALRFFPCMVRIILRKANRDYDSMYD